MSVTVKKNTTAVQHAPRLPGSPSADWCSHLLMGNFSIMQAEKGKRRDFLDKSYDPQTATTLRQMLSFRAPAQLVVVVGVRGGQALYRGVRGKSGFSLGMCSTAGSPPQRGSFFRSSGLGWKGSILGSKLLKVWELRHFASLGRWLAEVRLKLQWTRPSFSLFRASHQRNSAPQSIRNIIHLSLMPKNDEKTGALMPVPILLLFFFLS